MEAKKIKKPDVSLFISMDGDIVKKLRLRRAESGRPVNRIVEEILKRHFDQEVSAVRAR